MPSGYSENKTRELIETFQKPFLTWLDDLCKKFTAVEKQFLSYVTDDKLSKALKLVDAKMSPEDQLFKFAHVLPLLHHYKQTRLLQNLYEQVQFQLPFVNPEDLQIDLLIRLGRHKEAMELIEKSNSNLDYVNPYCQNNSLLQTAIEHYRPSYPMDIIKAILTNKPDLNYCNDEGNTVLHLACFYGFYNIAELLLQQKTPLDLDKENHQGYTALGYAVRNNNKKLVGLLLAASAKNVGKELPLNIAAQQGNTKIVDSFLRVVDENNHRKFDLDQKDKHHNTALHRAAIAGKLAVVRQLCDAGANVDAIGIAGNTPLILAAYIKNRDMVNYLLGCGAEVDIQNKFGNTALHIASANEAKSIVNLLLENFANEKILNNKGKVACKLSWGTETRTTYIRPGFLSPVRIHDIKTALDMIGRCIGSKKWRVGFFGGVKNDNVPDSKLTDTMDDIFNIISQGRIDQKTDEVIFKDVLLCVQHTVTEIKDNSFRALKPRDSRAIDFYGWVLELAKKFNISTDVTEQCLEMTSIDPVSEPGIENFTI